MNAYLMVEPEAGALVLKCRCGHVIGPAERPYKEGSLESRRPLQSLGPHFDPDRLGRDRFEVREYYCPSCVVLFEVEVARPSDPILVDVELDAPESEAP